MTCARVSLLFLIISGALGGCDDADPSEPPPAPDGLISVAETTPAWMGAWGHGDVLYVAGGTADQGAIGRIQSSQLQFETVPEGPHLWWIHGANPDAIWAVGAAGRILRRTANGWIPETSDAPAETVLWGVWGSSDTDLWAVGGTDRPGGPRGVILRSNGDGNWTRVMDPLLPIEDPNDEFAGLNIYKVWGSGPNDVHFVGEGGLALHWNGTMFTRPETNTPQILFTVHGQAGGLVLAVGGLSESVVRRWDGAAWIDDGAPAALPLNGVFVRPDGTAWASGARGLLMHRSVDGRWSRLEAPADANFGARTLHALWAPDRIWSVGGDLSALSDGVIAAPAGTTVEVVR